MRLSLTFTTKRVTNVRRPTTALNYARKIWGRTLFRQTYDRSPRRQMNLCTHKEPFIEVVIKSNMLSYWEEISKVELFIEYVFRHSAGCRSRYSCNGIRWILVHHIISSTRGDPAQWIALSAHSRAEHFFRTSASASFTVISIRLDRLHMPKLCGWRDRVFGWPIVAHGVYYLFIFIQIGQPTSELWVIHARNISIFDTAININNSMTIRYSTEHMWTSNLNLCTRLANG